MQVCDYGAEPRTGKEAVREAAEAVVLHPDFPRPVADGDRLEPTGTDGPAPDPRRVAPLPDDDSLNEAGLPKPVPDDLAGHLRAPMPDPRLNDEQRERDGRGQRNICAACGHPGTADNPLVISDGYRVHETHKTDPESGLHDPDWPAGIPHRRRGDASPATEGNAMPTGTAETTYDQTVAEANGIIAECEQEIARLQTRRLAAKVEQMASAGLDTGSIGRAMEIDDALKAQEKAAQQALDAAQAFRDGLKRDHGGMNEAHQNAPVVGAQPEFYAG